MFSRFVNCTNGTRSRNASYLQLLLKNYRKLLELLLFHLTLVTSYRAEKNITVRDFAPKEDPILFVVGAMAHGKV